MKRVGRLVGHGERVGLLFSPDGRRLATMAWSTGAITLWDLKTRQMVASPSGRWGTRPALAFAPDGGALAIGTDDGVVRLWSIRERREIAALRGHQKQVTAVAFSPDGKRVASGSTDETVRLWDVTERPREHLQGHTLAVWNLALSRDGKTLVSGGADRVARIWELPAGRSVEVLKGHRSGVGWVSLSPDGRHLVTGSDAIRVWELASQRQVLLLPRKEPAFIYPAIFSRDGRFLIWADDQDRLRVWEFATRREVARCHGHTNRVHQMVLSPDGKLLATGSGPHDGHVRVWDTTTWKQVAALPSRMRWAGPQEFSPDGKWLAMVSGDYTVLVWEVGTWRLLKTLRGYTAEVTSVSFTSDSRTLATTCHDGVVKLWSTASWIEAATIADAAVGQHGRFTPDDTALLGAAQDGGVRIWRAGTLAEAEAQLDRVAHERGATEAERARDWPAALAHLDALLQERPEDLSLLHRRGAARAEMGEWAGAAADFRKWFALGAKGLWEREQLAVAQWAAGDREGYRKTCAGLLALYRKSQTPDAAGAFARLAARVPDAADPAVAVELAEVALKAEPRTPGAMATLGAALLRAGRFEAAARQLKQAIDADRRGELFTPAVYLAMAQARLGRAAEARRLLDETARLTDPLLDVAPEAQRVRLGWDRRVELRLLREEAEDVVGSPVSR